MGSGSGSGEIGSGNGEITTFRKKELHYRCLTRFYLHLRLAQFNQIVRISSTLIAHSKHMNDETDFSKTIFIILLTFLWKKVYRLIITIECHALLLESFQH